MSACFQQQLPALASPPQASATPFKSSPPDVQVAAGPAIPHPNCTVLHAEHQTIHEVGASVYDNTHNQSRGFGEIQAATDPAADGTPRWRVLFPGGRRITSIQQPYLDLSLIHHTQRAAPCGLQQRIVVVVGRHKGKAGTTVKKVSAGLLKLAAANWLPPNATAAPPPSPPPTHTKLNLH